MPRQRRHRSRVCSGRPCWAGANRPGYAMRCDDRRGTRVAAYAARGRGGGSALAGRAGVRWPRCRQGPTRHGCRGINRQRPVVDRRPSRTAKGGAGCRGVNRQRPVVAVLAGSGQEARRWRRSGFGRRKARTRVRGSVHGPRARTCRTGALWQGDRPVPQGGPDRRLRGRHCVGHGRLSYA